MKICIPSETDAGLASPVHPHFGRAPYFSIVDLQTDAVEIVKNPQCHDHTGRCHHLTILKAHDVDTVVVTSMGHRALENLRSAGIEVLQSPIARVEDLVEAVRGGRCNRDFTRSRRGHRARHGGDHRCGRPHAQGRETGGACRRRGDRG